ncbi:hypothetical protein TNCV_1668221 [Trichonephila clavipes]|nr:hypothetical protein TNCV_1668221 [Trichonephila clavipes]
MGIGRDTTANDSNHFVGSKADVLKATVRGALVKCCEIVEGTTGVSEEAVSVHFVDKFLTATIAASTFAQLFSSTLQVTTYCLDIITECVLEVLSEPVKLAFYEKTLLKKEPQLARAMSAVATPVFTLSAF